jgi:AcrR family transcriptional regulator
VGLREEKKRRLRQEIAQAALDLFRERGYDQTRVRDIVERAEISAATFFNYFAAKEHVLDELALSEVELLRQAIAYHLITPRPGGVPQRIVELMQEAAGAIAADRDFQALLYTRSNLLHSSGALRERTHGVYRELSWLFELGQDRGEIRRGANPMQLAEMLIALYHFTAINWLTDWWSERDSLEDRMGAAIRIFLDGCCEPR